MDLTLLLKLLKHYDERFCFSIKSQLRDVARYEPLEDCNPNAIQEILDFLLKTQKCGVEDTEGLIDHLSEHLESISKK